MLAYLCSSCCRLPEEVSKVEKILLYGPMSIKLGTIYLDQDKIMSCSHWKKTGLGVLFEEFSM